MARRGRARGLVRRRERCRRLERPRELVLVERVDEDARFGRDELGRPADPRRDDRLARRPSPRGSPGRTARAATGAQTTSAAREVAGHLVVRTRGPTTRTPLGLRAARAAARRRRRRGCPGRAVANASASRTTFLRSVRLPTREERRPLRRQPARRSGRSARGRRPSRRPRSSRAPREASQLELAAQVVGDGDHRARALDDPSASSARRRAPRRCCARRARAR